MKSKEFKWFKYPYWSSCLGKKEFKSLIEASDAGRSVMYNNSNKVQLYIYKCDYCEKYHLTNTETENRVF